MIRFWRVITVLVVVATAAWAVPLPQTPAGERQRLLYVAVPGTPERVPAGILVYDVQQGHKLVKRIPMPDVDTVEKPVGFKGICANAKTKRLYASYGNKLACLDLASDELVWTRTYESGCDRMAITPDGKKIFMPTGYWTETPYWFVLDAASGDVLSQIEFHAKAHNTIASLDGKRVYLASLANPFLTVVDAEMHRTVRQVGPFNAAIRPFTVNGSGRLCFVNCNDLLGFEVGDTETGRKLYRVEVPGFEKGKVKYHGCPSHGVGMTPDETEVWVVDAANERMHIFDAATMPPKYAASIKLSDQPNWITFSLDGQYADPSTGDVIDTKSRKIVATLKNEQGNRVESEKLLEVIFVNGSAHEAGDQFGVGRVVQTSRPK